jgi:LPXTG-motif cell wall-anchored protein
MKLLALTKASDAVDVIALYLKHRLPSVQQGVAEDLALTRNPKAVPRLKDALLELEARLPPALAPESESLITTLLSYFKALSMIHNQEALAVLDASVNRLGEKYRRSDIGRELLHQLQFVRDTGGLHEYRRNTDVRSSPSVDEDASAAVPTPAKALPNLPNEERNASRPPAAISAGTENTQSMWLVAAVAAVALLGLGALIFFRKRRA